MLCKNIPRSALIIVEYKKASCYSAIGKTTAGGQQYGFHSATYLELCQGHPRFYHINCTEVPRGAVCVSGHGVVGASAEIGGSYCFQDDVGPVVQLGGTGAIALVFPAEASRVPVAAMVRLLSMVKVSPAESV